MADRRISKKNKPWLVKCKVFRSQNQASNNIQLFNSRVWSVVYTQNVRGRIQDFPARRVWLPAAVTLAHPVEVPHAPCRVRDVSGF